MKRGALQINIQRLKTLSLIDIVVEAQAELLFESPYLLLSPVIFSLATNLSPYHPCLSLKCSVLTWRLLTIGLMPCLGFPILHWPGQPSPSLLVVSARSQLNRRAVSVSS